MVVCITSPARSRLKSTKFSGGKGMLCVCITLTLPVSSVAPSYVFLFVCVCARARVCVCVFVCFFSRSFRDIWEPFELFLGYLELVWAYGLRAL